VKEGLTTTCLQPIMRAIFPLHNIYGNKRARLNSRKYPLQRQEKRSVIPTIVRQIVKPEA
jgi:hypothetical protein